jgi:hypothetical protein
VKPTIDCTTHSDLRSEQQERYCLYAGRFSNAHAQAGSLGSGEGSPTPQCKCDDL